MTLLMLAVFIIVILGRVDILQRRRRPHVKSISAVAAICLLFVYAGLAASPTFAPTPPRPSGDGARHGLADAAIVLLAASGAGAAFVSDWFIYALGPAIDSLGISRAFAGLVIVAIAGNAVENTTALVLARKGDSDLAISVVKNSVSQIAVFLFPALILVSLLFATPLTFVLPPVYIAASRWRRSRSGRSPATARRAPTRAPRWCRSS